jgi:glycerate kinase
MAAAHLEDHLADADLVLTAEGSLDAQTLLGKTPYGVAQAAARHGVPVIAFGGRVAPSARVLSDHGFAAVVPILTEVTDLPAALRDGPANLEQAVATALRLVALGAQP